MDSTLNRRTTFISLLGLLSTALISLNPWQNSWASEAQRQLRKRAPDMAELIRFEQEVNDKIENREQFATIRRTRLPEAYRPESGAVFPLYTVEVPEEEIQLFVTGPAPKDRVFVERDGKRFVKFYVHPQSEGLFKRHLPQARWNQELVAAATSSYRSLIAWNPKRPSERPFGVKVSLDATIGQVWRVLNVDQIETSAAISAWLNTTDTSRWARAGAHFMDEPVSGYLTEAKLGFSFRDYPELPKDRQLVPLFSYYSKDGGSPPLVLQALKASGQDPRTWVDQNILKPQTEHFMRLLLEEGIVGVPHEQNVLIETTLDGSPTGSFFYRDTGGFSVHEGLRRAAGKDLAFIPEGVSLKSVLLHGAHPMDQASTYLLQSNFYALREALEAEYPEISESWIHDRFRAHAVRASKRELGTLPTDLRELRSALSQRSNTAKQNIKPSCPELFRGLFQTVAH